MILILLIDHDHDVMNDVLIRLIHDQNVYHQNMIHGLIFYYHDKISDHRDKISDLTLSPMDMVWVVWVVVEVVVDVKICRSEH